MGSLAHFNLAGVRVLHGLRSFVETGTAQGDGVEAARLAGFDPIHSIEIVPEIASAARFRFAEHKQVRIWDGKSIDSLPLILKDLPPEPAMFWLDAHFPGAHHHADYSAEADAAVRLPLDEEIRMIRAARPTARDVLVIDDARIYQPGPYGGGDLPADWPPLAGVNRSAQRLDFIRELYGQSHGVVVDFADQGYVMVFPHVLLKRAA